MAGATATAEAPKSSSGGGGSGDSYIGSLISLTSKSEIRYEGVLYNINTQESTIGLRNVRSFGTEGRKRDGPQVPPSDKIYEFILFRGSDIKDLQVKSSPPVQTTKPIHTDPAIIQSHYPQTATASMTMPSSSTGSLKDSSSHASPHELSMPTFQGNLPLYQPGGKLGSQGSLSNPPTTSGTGLAMPMYWQGYYDPSNGLQPHQQTLLHPPPGLSIPPSIQQYVQHPATDASKLSASQMSENPPLSFPSFSTGTQNMQSSILPVQSSPTVPDSANLISNKASVQALPAASVNINLPMASPLTSALDKSFIASPVIIESRTVDDPLVPSKSMSESLSSNTRALVSVSNEGAIPSLVTPGHFLQPGTVPSLQSSQAAQKDVEAVQSSESPPPSTVAVMEMQEPILPLPCPPDRRVYGAPMHTYHGSRGHERGRGNRVWDAATRFEEDFDFTAMNEKFNKDEVWGHLGKSNKAQEDEEESEDEDNELSKYEKKPVYVKDDFFDSLSCGSLGGGSRNGSTGFSGQIRKNTETFGNFSRHRGGGGGWGPGRGGRSRGGYHGRGYGYGYLGRGRGYTMPNRDI
ncbi:protein decapping 5 [Ricinus communis]|uniref:Uncharacterized protein n=1 Tax=Ricinus communis TaxID=3988 RepID=B9SIZ7_RICCO|nr:protein decapping 5 [Ricinus communis]EEF36390.1 conserved hypothetical protein [Ricinus communis]|eukprot:XP_002525966.1 protein decapping 5 [Ricinus communis]